MYDGVMVPAARVTAVDKVVKKYVLVKKYTLPIKSGVLPSLKSFATVVVWAR